MSTIYREDTIANLDRPRLFVRLWEPPALTAAPRATIMICHGVNEHAGRYEHVAARLVTEGYRVCARTCAATATPQGAGPGA
jgi:alpha-beta hydrolase superfamily lysophospholipase